MKKYLIPILIIILSTSGLFLWKKNKQKTPTCPNTIIICTDGSSVFPHGPQCEFSACPQTPPNQTQKNAVSTTSSNSIPTQNNQTTLGDGERALYLITVTKPIIDMFEEEYTNQSFRPPLNLEELKQYLSKKAPDIVEILKVNPIIYTPPKITGGDYRLCSIFSGGIRGTLKDLDTLNKNSTQTGKTYFILDDSTVCLSSK